MSNDMFADIERAIETKQPVTRSFNIGGKRCQEPTDEVIDIDPRGTSVPEEKPGSRWDSEPFNKRYGEGTPVHAPRECGSPRTSFLPVSTEKQVMAPEVSRLLKMVEGSQLPTDLVSDLRRGIYFALIEFVFSILIDEFRIQLFKKLGCDYSQACRYVGDWKSASKTMSDSVITIAVKILDRGRCISALILGYLLGLKPEYCFRTFPCKEEAPSGLPIRCTQIQERIPNQLVVRGRLYLLESIDYQNDFRGMKEQAVCFYMDKACPKNNFFLIANRVEKNGNYVLEIGTAPVPARLYSRAEMAVHENATIIICMDMYVAMEFRRIANECFLFERERIIISGVVDGSSAVEALDLRDSAGNAVVYVPEFNREALVSAPKFAERCEKAGATSVSIYPWPIIASKNLFCNEKSAPAQWRNVLLEQAVRLEDVELPSKLCRKVCEKAIPISEYAEWMKSIDLVTTAKGDLPKINHKINFLSFDDLPEGFEQPDIPTLDDLIIALYLTFIWGVSNAGKSWVAIQLVLAIVTGTDAFGISAKSRRVVCYMDGEVGSGDFKKRCLQLLQGRVEEQEILSQNLHVLPPSSDIDILDDACVAEIISSVLEMKGQVLVIDNIFSLAPSAVHGGTNQFLSFVKRVKQAGIALVIIHHSGKDGTTYKGPSEFHGLSQNIIWLEGREQISKQGGLNDDLKKACSASGPVTRITIKKCKAAPFIEQRSAIYHLPVNGTWRNIGGSLLPDHSILPENDGSESTEEDTGTVHSDPRDAINLSSDEEKVCMALKGRKLTRPALQDVTGFKADKLGGILRKLVALNLVKKEGAGKATYYRGV